MDKILRLPKVKDVTGLARSTIYKRMKEKTFPRQRSLGPKAVGWVEAEVQKWIQEKITEQNESSGN